VRSIGFRLAPLLESIADDDKLGRAQVESVRHYELGKIDDAPLTFTDGCALGDGSVLFSAVAEQADDAYVDGPCRGAAVGAIGSDGRLRRIEYLDQPWKIEGIAGGTASRPASHLAHDRRRIRSTCLRRC
jgi:hypothetical protein